MLHLKKIVLATSLIIAVSGCSNKSTGTLTEAISDPNSNVSQTAMSEAGGSASASEGGTVGFITENIAEMNYLADFIDSKDAIHPLANPCTFSTVRSSCTGSIDTISWNSCTVNNGLATLTGGWTETYTGTGSSTCTIPVASGGSVARTSTGSTITLASSGATITTDTNGGTAYDGTVIPATGETVANTSGTRTITIGGVHKLMRGPLGRTWFDYFMTSPGLTATGSRAGNNRSLSGSLTLYHNIAKYTATNTFNTVVWGSSTCCYPTSGNISSSFTGSLTGTTTLTFSSTCGAATFVDTTGASSSLTLTQCN